MDNLNEFTPIEMQGDAPNRHTRRTVESLIADHVADAYAIEFIAQDGWYRLSFDPNWKDLPVEEKSKYILNAKRDVLTWLNREQGTDYHLED